MPSSKRLLPAIVVLAAFALFYAVWPGGPDKAGRNSLSLEEETRREQQLVAQRQELFRGVEIRRQIRVDLIEGRRTYAQAVAASIAEDAERPPALRSRVEYLPGRSKEEQFSWMLLSHLTHELRDNPRQANTLPRLREQCRRHLASLGSARDFARTLQLLNLDPCPAPR
jgi:hypothetical protein